MTSGSTSNADLAAHAVVLQGQRDFAALRAICDPDVVLEFPFHPNGPATFHGVDALIGQFGVLAAFETLEVVPVEVFDTGGDVVIVEGRSRGTYRSGRPDYLNHYLFVLSFRNGKLTRWREFFNPIEAMKQNYGKARPAKGASDRDA